MSDDTQSAGPATTVPSLSPTAITAIAATFAALISAAVSWTVSNRTLEVERTKALTEDTVRRATVFSELMQKVGEDRNAGYAILALWKLYERDRKLVVITALQSEDPQAIAVLKLLGLEDELKPYAATVRSVLQNSRPGQRAALLNLYAQIDPRGVVDESVEKILGRNRTAFAATKDFDELVRMTSDDPSVLSRLEEIVESDPRLAESLVNRFTLAFALHLARRTDAFDRLIAAGRRDIQGFASLADLLVQARVRYPYRSRDYEGFIDASIDLMRAVRDGVVEADQFLSGFELFAMASKETAPTAIQTATAFDLFEWYFKASPDRRFERERILTHVATWEQARAERLLHHVLACERPDRAELYFNTSSALEMILGTAEVPDFATARTQSARWLSSNRQSCDGWRI